MKKIYLVFTLILLNIYCFGQGKIKKLEVEEQGFNIKMIFKKIVDELTIDGITYKITPISAAELNEIFLKEGMLNGKFEYSHYEKSRNTYFLKNVKKSKTETPDYDFLLEGVNWLLDNDQININEHGELIKLISRYYDDSIDFELIEREKIILCNPFYLGNKYLNVFKIEITNPTNAFHNFDKKLIIESGNSIIEPLTDSQIITELQRNNLMNTDKSLILKRHNICNLSIIPPKSQIVKYFAVLPLDYNNTNCKITFTNCNSFFNWTVNNNVELLNDKFTFLEFNTSWSLDKIKTKSGIKFNFLVNPSNKIYINNGKVFILEDNLNDEFELLSYVLWGNYLYFGREKFKGAPLLDFSKNRRSPLQIQTNKIEAVNKESK